MSQLPYRAVIIDFDRTLLHTDKSVSGYAVRVLRECRDAGIRLFAATARPERAITEYLGLIPFDAFTTLNGARTVAGSRVSEFPLSPRSAESVLLRLLETGGMVVSAEAENGIYANTDIPAWAPAVISDIQDLPRREKIYKVLASHPRVPVGEIGGKLPADTYSSVADRKLVQFMSKSATKWNGIRKMLEIFGIDPSRAVCFGDDNDDLEPILRCGCGVAVSNALECVRDAADFVTGSNDEDGVAVWLSAHVLSRG